MENLPCHHDGAHTPDEKHLLDPLSRSIPATAVKEVIQQAAKAAELVSKVAAMA